jgi:hypothetical protein
MMCVADVKVSPAAAPGRQNAALCLRDSVFLPFAAGRLLGVFPFLADR